MERDVYNAICTSFRKKQYEEKWELLDKVTALQSLSFEEKETLVDALDLVRQPSAVSMNSFLDCEARASPVCR